MNSDIQRDLEQAADLLLRSFLIFYRHYSYALKAILLLLIFYFCYQLGRLTVRQPLQAATQQLKKAVEKRQAQTMVPQRLKGLAKKRSNGLWIAGIVAVTLLGLELSGAWRVSIEMYFYVAGVVLLTILPILAYEKYLSTTMKSAVGSKEVEQCVLALKQRLGPKISQVLKIGLCREKILNRSKVAANQCVKKDCQEKRGLLKSRFQAIWILVQSVLSFDWCSKCKHKLVFDEVPGYQSHSYEQGQGDEVDRRNAYLLGQVEAMCAWVKRVEPCNCSKIYWAMSQKEVLLFKQAEKAMGERLKKVTK